MPARPVIQADVDYLKKAWASNTPLPVMAGAVGCHIDTLKRILNREGIAIFEAAKYQSSNRRRTATWNRPCLKCGSTKSRPRMQFICKPCTDSNNDYAWPWFQAQDAFPDQWASRWTRYLELSRIRGIEKTFHSFMCRSIHHRKGS